MKIKAAVLEAQGSLDNMKIQEVDIIEPRMNEVRVKIVGAGICHTDIAQSKNEWGMTLGMPMVMGHEGSGIVESVGPGVTKVKPGDKVVMSIPYCGECDECKKGETWYCEQVVNLHLLTEGVDFYGTTPLSRDGEPIRTLFQQGSFAEYVVTHINCITKVEDDTDIRLVGPLGCGLRTGAGAVYNELRPRPAEWVCITGCGAVGLAAMWMANAMGAKTIIVDVADSRLEAAKKYGAYKIINTKGMNQDEMMQAMREAADGKGAQYLVETTGVEPVIKAAMKAMCGGGRCAEIAIVNGMNFESYTNDCNDCHSVSFNRMGNVGDVIIPVMIDLYKRGKFPFDELIKYYPFEKIREAMDDHIQGKVIKPVLVFDK